MPNLFDDRSNSSASTTILNYGRTRLLPTVNRQESLLTNTRICTIEPIVILECWRLLTTPINNQLTAGRGPRSKIIVYRPRRFIGQTIRIAAVDELNLCSPMPAMEIEQMCGVGINFELLSSDFERFFERFWTLIWGNLSTYWPVHPPYYWLLTGC